MIRHQTLAPALKNASGFPEAFLLPVGCSLLDAPVVLLVVDGARGAVLLVVDLPALGRSQLAAVGRAVIVDFID